MSEELLIKHCSPTLAGLKTGSMFSISFNSANEMVSEFKRINALLVKKGLCAIPIKKKSGSYLFYVYRPDCLRKDLMDPEAQKILLGKGYPVESTAKCLSCLLKKVCQESEFPHEIGLFLGYPPEDVAGFIENAKGEEKAAYVPKHIGHWKVYGDTENAFKLFSKYDKCKTVYAEMYKKGKTLDQLIVPVRKRAL